jgi:hypothetical protein
MNDEMRRRWRKLTREDVEKAMLGIEPEEIRDLASSVNDRWYPVKQPVTTALRVSRSDVNSRQAWRMLRRLGFATHDRNADGALPSTPGGGRRGPDGETRKLALTLAAEVNRGSGVSGRAVIAMAEEFERYLGRSPGRRRRPAPER